MFLTEYNIFKTVLLIIFIIFIVVVLVVIPPYNNKKNKNSHKQIQKKPEVKPIVNEVSNTLRVIKDSIEKNAGELQKLSSKIDKNNDLLIDLKKIIVLLKNEIHKLELKKSKNSNLKSLKESNYNLEKNKQSHIPSKVNQTIYLSMSDVKGHFVKSSRNIKEGQTYFQLEILQSNSNEGLFEIINNNKVIRNSLLMNIRDYLKPVCDIENENIHNPVEIISLQKGRANFDGNRWIAVQKAKIKLI